MLQAGVGDTVGRRPAKRLPLASTYVDDTSENHHRAAEQVRRTFVGRVDLVYCRVNVEKVPEAWWEREYLLRLMWSILVLRFRLPLV